MTGFLPGACNFFRKQGFLIRAHSVGKRLKLIRWKIERQGMPSVKATSTHDVLLGEVRELEYEALL